MGFGKKKKPMGLAALAGETAKMAKNMMVLDKTEAAMEKELAREEQRADPVTKIGKVRRKGEHMLHGKYVLLMVVVLNVIDCLLVLGELMLDIKYVTDLLTKEYHRTEEFVGSMKGLYPARLGFLQYDDIEILEHEILTANITWSPRGHHDNTGTSTVGNQTCTTNCRRRRDAIDVTSGGNSSGVGVINDLTNATDPYAGLHRSHGHSLEEDIAHGLHKASISILGILVVETMIKIFCYGKVMLEHKLECFDSFIVVVSFIVDLVFLKGLQQFAVQDFVLILAFMVPWRIIRVVNSLVVAIMDHEHFRLKIIYKQKKKTSNELKEAKDELKGLEACIDALERMCMDAGLPENIVKAKLNMYRKVKAKTNAMGAMSSFAIGGDAMNKPFSNGVPKTVVTVENEAEHTGRSAIEYTDRKRAEQQSSLVKQLAQNSAAFIATINKDDVEVRLRSGSQRSMEEKNPDPTSTEMNASTHSTSTDDSYDSKTKADTDVIVTVKTKGDNPNNQADNDGHDDTSSISKL